MFEAIWAEQEERRLVALALVVGEGLENGGVLGALVGEEGGGDGAEGTVVKTYSPPSWLEIS